MIFAIKPQEYRLRAWQVQGILSAGNLWYIGINLGLKFVFRLEQPGQGRGTTGQTMKKFLNFHKGVEMPENVLSGDQLAWAMVVEKEPSVICKQADVQYDFVAHKFIMRCFAQEILVDAGSYTITSHSPLGETLLHGLGHFFDLAALWYLGKAKNIPPSGRMISPASISGGEIFQKGTHVLPLDQIAARYGSDFKGFYKRGVELGGQHMEYGDACLRFFPFPRVPVTMILWGADDEFPARADMFFDATCEQHLPPDVIWSTAMTSVLIML